MTRYKLTQYIAKLQGMESKINAAQRNRLAATASGMVGYAKSVAHRDTGHMANTIGARLYSRSSGSTSVTISSAASYAKYECDRGGQHDWAGVTTRNCAWMLGRLAEGCSIDVARELT